MFQQLPSSSSALSLVGLDWKPAMARTGSSKDWLEWLTGPDEGRQKEATLILGGLTPDDPVDLGPLLFGLLSSDRQVRFWSIVAVGRLGPGAAGALPELKRIALCDPEFGLREGAVSALTRIAPADSAVKATVFAALGDTHPAVRREALRATMRLPAISPAELTAIKGLERDPDAGVVRWSEIALRNIRLRGASLDPDR